MLTRQRTIAAMAGMVGMLAATLPALAQWQGQAVTVDRRYPDANTVKMNLGTKTISAKGVNYLAGKVTVQVFPAQVRIMLSPLGGPTPYRADTFNGFQITGAGTLPPVIGGVTINPQTHLSGFDSSRVTWAANYVQVNLAGLTLGVKDRVWLDVQFATKKQNPRRTRRVTKKSQR